MRHLTKIVLGGGLFLVLAGALLALTGWALGGETTMELEWRGHSFQVTPSGVYGANGENRGDSADLNLEAFDRLEVDVALGDVIVQQGDDYGVELSWRGKNYELSYTNENGKLKVWSISPKGLSIGLGGGGHDALVTVYVPADTELKTVDMESNLGGLDIYGITADRLTVEADMGDVALDDVTANSLTLNLSMGNLSATDLTVNTTLTAHNNLGDMNLEGDIAGSVELKCNMGSMEMYTSQSAATFGYDLSVSLGEITLDGAGYERDAKRAGGPNHLTAENDMGDIEITFAA